MKRFLFVAAVALIAGGYGAWCEYRAQIAEAKSAAEIRHVERLREGYAMLYQTQDMIVDFALHRYWACKGRGGSERINFAMGD